MTYNVTSTTPHPCLFPFPFSFTMTSSVHQGTGVRNKDTMYIHIYISLWRYNVEALKPRYIIQRYVIP